ncbi:cilia- and flagella-associated protein 410 isoform X1 [Octopus sinensis]|uniref:Cilia- and flagella-associated protein 410 isoform X1 n=1 Tax=Octopus sinensis TaxID=2607531 RepID=A0A6P7S5I7_9MOLL|nr:cilia- and flagella-associated protein 410 isoform X1 [Octopus sinensis]
MESSMYPCCIAPIDTTFLREKPLIGGRVLTEEMVLKSSNVKSLTAVERLNLWSCDLSDITVMNKLPNLEVCSISSNFIESIKDFQNCKKLRELYVRNNNISTLGELCYLKELPNLKVLWIQKNPISELENYRNTVIRTLPNIEKLDNVHVTEAEKETAKKEGFEICIPKEPTPPTKQDTPTFSNWRQTIELSIEEINKVRIEHNLEPLHIDKLLPPSHTHKRDEEFDKNNHILQAVFELIKELDETSLMEIHKDINFRLQAIRAYKNKINK